MEEERKENKRFQEGRSVMCSSLLFVPSLASGTRVTRKKKVTRPRGVHKVSGVRNA